MLDIKLALKIAARLTVVKEFPRYPEAIDAVAEDLIDLTFDCDNEEAERRARWTVETIRRTWSEWGGQSDLFQLYQWKWAKPREVKAEDNEVKNYGDKPKIECLLCNDTGVLRPGGRDSKEPYVWCECEAGILLHLDFPQWLDFLNRTPTQAAEPLPEVHHPASARTVKEEIERSLTPVPSACPACQQARRHTYSEYWTHHTTQEIAQ